MNIKIATITLFFSFTCFATPGCQLEGILATKDETLSVFSKNKGAIEATLKRLHSSYDLPAFQAKIARGEIVYSKTTGHFVFASKSGEISSKLMDDVFDINATVIRSSGAPLAEQSQKTLSLVAENFEKGRGGATAFGTPTSSFSSFQFASDAKDPMIDAMRQLGVKNGLFKSTDQFAIHVAKDNPTKFIITPARQSATGGGKTLEVSADQVRQIADALLATAK